MRIRVKGPDHINLDGLTPGQLSVLIQGLELVKAKGVEEGNHVAIGLSVTLIDEIGDALDEVGEVIQGPAREARKKRKEAEAAALREKSGTDGIMAKCREELAALDTPEVEEAKEPESSVGDGQTETEEHANVRKFLKEELGREPSQEEVLEWIAPATTAASSDRCD